MNKYDIVCISFPSWNGTYMKSTVQLMKRLALTNKVLFVDYPYTYKDMAASFIGHQHAPVDRMLDKKKRLRKVKIARDRYISVLTLPPTLPINFLPEGNVYDRLLDINGSIVLPEIKKAMIRLKMHNPIVINAFNPFLGLPLAGKLNESLLVYYCYDDIGGAAWAGKHGARLEQQFIQKSDAVITSSEGLFKKCKSQNANTFVVKNGVDFRLFEQGQRDQTKDPSNLCIGYLGSLNDRLNYELLSEMCKQAPEYTFLFVGRVTSDKARSYLGRYSNVIMTGPKSPQELPAYIAKMDAGIIPFRRTSFNRHIYPLKINEYMAAGIPVVMTDFAPLDEFRPLIAVENKPYEFLEAIRSEVIRDNPARREARIAMAQSNSWEHRSIEFNKIIRSQLVKSSLINPSPLATA